MGESDRIKKSLLLVEKNLVLFVPNLLMLVSNFFLLILFFHFTGFSEYLMGLRDPYNVKFLFNLKNGFLFITYILLVILTDNFFSCSKYGMIKDVILKGKANLEKGFKFGKKHYFTTLKIHLTIFSLMILPVLLFILFFAPALMVYPIFTIPSIALFICLLIAYLIYLSIRLLFVYPVMAFEDKGPGDSFTGDFHYVKAHLQHTIMTWVIIVGVAVVASMIRSGLENYSSFFPIKLFPLVLLFSIFLILLEMFVSMWEHVFIFESYIDGKKTIKKRKTKKRTTRKK
jgi:hypothetical protein